MSRRRPPRERGFTLIELIVAAVIIAILAAIAIPSYQNYVLKSHRTEAKTALLDLASMEERYFSAQNAYSQNPSEVGYSGATFPVTVGNGYYQVNIYAPGWAAATAPTGPNTAGTPATFAFIATPLGNQVNDSPCAAFILTSGNLQTATDISSNPNPACWN